MYDAIFVKFVIGWIGVSFLAITIWCVAGANLTKDTAKRCYRRVAAVASLAVGASLLWLCFHL